MVLQPQWLLNRLADFMYDVSVHGSNRSIVHPKLLEDVVRYENNALLSLPLLNTFWENVEETERSFLLRLLKRYNILTEFQFRVKTEVLRSKNSQLFFLVPAMLRHYDNVSESILQNKSENECISVEFNQLIPLGVFEFFVCAFVKRSGEFEGSKQPHIRANYCEVYFEETKLVVQMAANNSIICRVQREQKYYRAS